MPHVRRHHADATTPTCSTRGSAARCGRSPSSAGREDTEDLRRFYPTDVCVTARDIIFLWVARMIFTGLRFTGRTPFSDVIITSTVQAADGTRMSKSKGNAVDPLVMIEEHGADAVRAWAAAVGTGGQDVRFNEERIRSYQALRQQDLERHPLPGGAPRRRRRPHVGRRSTRPTIDELLPEDRWMLSRVADTVEAVDEVVAHATVSTTPWSGSTTSPGTRSVTGTSR